MKLKRTTQCAKCPWRKDVDPHDIPNGYCIDKHKALESTIAKDGGLTWLGQPVKNMACHETHDSPCVGWLHNQLGEGNNIPLRLAMRNYDNAHKLKLVGEQHKTFQDTLPARRYSDKTYLETEMFMDRDVEVRCRTVKLIKTRKEQRCAVADMNQEPHQIPKGSRVVVECAIVEGQWGSCHYCLDCMDKWLDHINGKDDDDE